MAKLRFSLRILFVVIALGGFAPGAQAIEKGKFVPWAYICHFGKYGEVNIEGMQRGIVNLVVGGKVYRVDGGGSYFFSAGDNGPTVYFGPEMQYFEYNGVRDNHCLRLTGATKLAPAGGSQWSILRSKRELPQEALVAFVEAFGELADRDQPFRATDVVLPGQELPHFRFIQARSNGREVILDFEQGGRGYSRRTVRFQLANGHWVLVGTTN